MTPVEFHGMGSASMRIDGEGVTHSYIRCGECGRPMSPRRLEEPGGCPCCMRMAAALKRREDEITAHQARMAKLFDFTSDGDIIRRTPSTP